MRRHKKRAIGAARKKFLLNKVQINCQQNQSGYSEDPDNQRVNKRYLYRDDSRQIHEPEDCRADYAVPNYLERQRDKKHQRGDNQHTRDQSDTQFNHLNSSNYLT